MRYSSKFSMRQSEHPTTRSQSHSILAVSTTYQILCNLQFIDIRILSLLETSIREDSRPFQFSDISIILLPI